MVYQTPLKKRRNWRAADVAFVAVYALATAVVLLDMFVWRP